jgi:hypothetical protein
MVEGKPALVFNTGLAEILKERLWKRNGPGVQVLAGLRY